MMEKQDTSTAEPRLRFPEFRGTKGWEEIKIGSIATILKGKGIAKSDVVTDGERPCIRYGELYTRYGEVIDTVYSRTNAPLSDLFISHGNDVIIPASGETKLDIAKASCVIHDGVALGGDLNVLRTDHNGVFLSYFLNGSKRFEIAKVAQGDTVVHLYPSQLQEIFVAAPEPAEQQKIADCLTSLDELIAARGRKVEGLKAHKRGLIQQLFPSEGETRPRLRFPEFRNAPEWSEEKLGNLVDIRSGNSPSHYQLSKTGAYPFVKVEDLNNCVKYQSEAREYSTDTSGIIPSRSLIFPKRGAAIELNKIRLNAREILMDTNMMALTPNGELRIEFLFYCISHIGLSQIADSSTIPQINNKHIIPFKVVVPSPDEQQRIDDCLSSLDIQIASESDRLAALKTHKQGLMQQLFPAPETANA